MNKVMNAITNKIIDLLRGRPVLDIGGVSVWGDFTDDEKERLRHTLLDGQNSRERAKELEVRIAELESIATDYAGKFQKAQDAAKHLIIMNDSAQAEIAHLKAMLVTPVRLPDAYQTSCGESEKYLCPVEVAEAIRPRASSARGMMIMGKFSELKAAAEKYSLTLNAHRENPRDIDAIRAWDEAATELSRITSHDETNIIIALLTELAEKDKESIYFCNLNAQKNERIAELERARFIAWPGNMFAPVLARIKVDVKRRDGSVSIGQSGGNVIWYHSDKPNDVVAFALTAEANA